MDEEYELLGDYAKKNGVGPEFAQWAKRCRSLVTFLSDPHNASARDRVFRQYKRDALSGAQLESIYILQDAVTNGRLLEPTAAEAHGLLKNIDWRRVFSSRLSYWNALDHESSYAHFARRYQFNIWDQINEIVRGEMAMKVLGSPSMARFLLFLGASAEELPKKTDNVGDSVSAPERDLPDSASAPDFLRLIIDAYILRPEEPDLRKVVWQEISSRGWLPCESLPGWDIVYDAFSAKPIDSEGYDTHFIRFLLCCSNDSSFEANPSLTTDAVLGLIGGESREIVNNRIRKLLATFEYTESDCQQTDWAAEFLVTWLYESFVATADQVECDEEASRTFWSVVDTIDERKKTDITKVVGILPFAACVMRAYPAILDGLERFLTMPNAAQCMVFDQVGFLLAAAVLAGRGLQNLGSIADLPFVIVVAQEMVNRVSPGMTGRKMLGPEHFVETVESQPPQLPDQALAVVKKYQEVDRLFATWLERMPREMDGIASHLSLMTRLLQMFSDNKSGARFEEPVFWVPLPEHRVFRVNAQVHRAFFAQAQRFLDNLEVPYANPKMDQTSSCRFLTSAILLGVLTWLEASSDRYQPAPRWIRDKFLMYVGLAFDAVKIGAAGKGPFARLPSSRDTTLLMCLCTGLLATLRSLDLADIPLKPLLLGFRSIDRPVVPANLAVDRQSLQKADDPAWIVPELIHTALWHPRKDDAASADSVRMQFIEIAYSKFGRRQNAIDIPAQPGWDPNKTEPDPRWRVAYIHALVDLRANPGGKTHRLLLAVSQNDVSDKVRAAARDGLNKLQNQRHSFADVSPKRAFLNAWWWLRKCHLESLDIDVDEKEAYITRLREVRE
jgi:hypothetical protein